MRETIGKVVIACFIICLLAATGLWAGIKFEGATGLSLGDAVSVFVLKAGDTMTGDLTVEADLSVTGESQFTGLTTHNGNTIFNAYWQTVDNVTSRFGSGTGDWYMVYSTVPTNDVSVMGLGTDSRTLLICDSADVLYNWGITKATNPTLILRSANTITNEYASLNLDPENLVIKTGTGNVSLEPASGIVTVQGTLEGGGSSFDIKHKADGEKIRMITGSSGELEFWRGEPYALSGLTGNTTARFVGQTFGRVSIISDSGNSSILSYGNETDEDVGGIFYTHASDTIGFRTGGLSNGPTICGATLETTNLIVDGSSTIAGDRAQVWADNTVHVKAMSDFPAAVGGIITLETDVRYVIDAALSTSDRFFISSGSSNQITSSWGIQPITYTGTGAFFSGDSITNLSLENMTLTSTSTLASFVDFANGAAGVYEFNRVNLVNWEKLGTFESTGTVLLNSTLHYNCAQGYNFLNVDTADFNNVLFNDLDSGLIFENGRVISLTSIAFKNTSDNGATFLTIEDGSNVEYVIVTDSSFTTLSNEAAFDIDPNISSEANVSLRGNFLLGTGEFFKTGTTGAISAFYDAGGGKVTVECSAPHGLSNGQTLLIDETINYDGGYAISNASGLSFEITATFVTTEAGVFDTGSLTGSNIRMSVKGNSGVQDSKITGSFNINNNAAETAIGIATTWYNFNLNDSAVESSNNERWRLTDATSGEIEYRGKEDFSGNLIAVISCNSAASTQNFQFRAVKNGLPLTDGILAERSIAAAVGSITLQVPITVTTGDKIRLQTQNLDGVSNLIVKHLSVNIQ